MSEWRDRKQAASFRGVPFWVDTDNVPVGRRTQVHEYPQRDQPYTEDMGRQTRKYRFSGFVVGDDCLSQRDRLLTALDKPGAGELVHPWFGRLTVTAGECEVSHARDEGGMVRFALEFIDGTLEFPVQAPNTKQQLVKQQDSLLASIQSRFSTAMAAVNLAGQRARALRTALSSVYAFGINFLKPMTSLASDLDAFVNDLVNAPDAFAASLLSDLTRLERTFDGYGAGSQLKSSQAMAEAIPALQTAAPVTSTADEAAIQAAVIGLIQDAAILGLVLDMAEVPIADVSSSGQAASLAAQMGEQGLTTVAGAAELTSVPVADDILELRDAISEAVWAVAADSAPDHFSVLSDARLRLDRHLTEVARSGVWLRAYTPRQTVPSLVLAYSLYGDALRGAEIVSRNRIRHPGFVPATELQVAKS